MTLTLPSLACPRCDAIQLAHRILHDGELAWACHSCDTPLAPGASVQWVEPQALEEVSLTLDGKPVLPPSQAPSKGCRGGACGVQQAI